jgi:hypothetical protein
MKRIVLLLLFTSSLAAAPRRLLVEFKAGPSAASIRSDAAELRTTGIRVRREFSRTFRGAAVELRDGQSIADVARLPYVANVYPDSEVVAYGGEGSPAVPHVPRAHGGGSGIVVAVLDSGIDATHPALAGKVIGGYDFVNDDNDPMDDYRHGTHVAGIIAAQSAEVTGVAPGVRLLSYKVLGADGKGHTSDIIAALERALDPNGDGDPSDRADVINLSLGGRGRPDDPMSRAVDAAVAAGAVVCVAAGNDEFHHTIGSPAGAARAITVGASYGDGVSFAVAEFSSRGPATVSGAIKPDLLAPGVSIKSTGLGHGTLVLSGTSMATPYVSGLAALLLEEHPDWTPERVKAALVTTAGAIPGEEVMTQGTGVVDLTRARTNTMVATPTQLNFGLDGVTAPGWTATQRITLRNDGTTARTIVPRIEGASASILVATATEVTLGPGESRDVNVTVSVDNGTLGMPPTASLAFGGAIVLEGGGEGIRVPWAFLRAGRATITSDAGRPQALWSSGTQKYSSAGDMGDGGLDILLQPGVYDFVMASEKEGDVRLVIAEERSVEGEVALAMTAEDAPYEIRFDGTDHRGVPFPDGDGVATLHSALARLVLPYESSIMLPAGRSLRTSAFSERYALLGTEAFVDRASAQMWVAQYPPLRGVVSDRVLRVLPGDYAAQEVELHFPAGGARREVGIMPRDWPRRPTEFGPQPPSLRFAADTPSWRGTLYLTPEVHDDFGSGLQLSLFTNFDPNQPASMNTPMIRRNANGFYATRGFGESPLPIGVQSGETMTFGHGPVHAPLRLQANAQGMSGDYELYGDREERRRAEAATTRYRVLDSAGVQVAAGAATGGTFFAPLPRAGAYTAEFRVGAYAFDNRIGEAVLTTRFNTATGEASPPIVTSFSVLDEAGRHVTRLPVNGQGTLVFSAADSEGGAYRKVNAPQVFFRRRGSNTWVQLTPLDTGLEETSPDLGRQAVGTVYRVDLRDALRLGAGEYELAIELTDAQGSTTTWQPALAFITETAPQPRRRAAGK